MGRRASSPRRKCPGRIARVSFRRADKRSPSLSAADFCAAFLARLFPALFIGRGSGAVVRNCLPPCPRRAIELERSDLLRASLCTAGGAAPRFALPQCPELAAHLAAALGLDGWRRGG